MPTSTVRILTKHQASSHNIYAEDQVQTHAGPVVATVSVSPYEPYLVDSVGHVLVSPSFLTPSLSSPSSVGCPKFQGEPNGALQFILSQHNVWLWGSHLLSYTAGGSLFGDN